MVRPARLRPTLVSLSLLLLALLTGCRDADPIISVTDTGQAERLSIGKTAGQGPVKQLRLQVEGQLNGTAQLVVIMEGQPFHVFTLSDSIDLSWKDRWPHDRARLAYNPGTATGGSLRIRYRFVD
jgi:hypothetical protein